MSEIPKTRKCAELALAFLTMFCAHAGALPLAFDATIPTPPEPDPIGGVVIAGGVPVNFSSLPGPGNFFGTLTASVISGDVTNPLGGLTFTYLLRNDADSHASLARFTNLDFSGYLCDVSFQAPTAGLPPTSTDRSLAPGTSIGWNFSALGLGELPPGTTSALMVIQTNATDWRSSDANVIDGSIATVASFGPAPIPEPASAIVLLFGGATMLGRRVWK